MQSIIHELDLGTEKKDISGKTGGIQSVQF